jgi:hypothetical protein
MENSASETHRRPGQQRRKSVLLRLIGTYRGDALDFNLAGETDAAEQWTAHRKVQQFHTQSALALLFYLEI